MATPDRQQQQQQQQIVPENGWIPLFF